MRRGCLRAMIRVGGYDVRLGASRKGGIRQNVCERNVTFDVQVREQLLFLLWRELCALHGTLCTEERRRFGLRIHRHVVA